jgi:uncharacterized protein
MGARRLWSTRKALMTPQERDLITTLLARLKNAAGQPRDPEADALISQAMAAQPDAPYYLVQTVLIQDLSLHNAQDRIAELERQVAGAQQQAARPAGFLASIFGSRQPAPASGGVPPAGPWTRAPQVASAPMAQPYQQPPYAQPQSGFGPAAGGGFMGGVGSGGGGFLRSAAATAAGIAGGALVFQGIESLFGHGGGVLGGQATPGLGESVINNYYGSDAGQNWGGGGQDFSSNDAGGQDSSSDQDFGGGQDLSSDQDFGGGQDFSSDQDIGGGDFGGGGDNFSC